MSLGPSHITAPLLSLQPLAFGPPTVLRRTPLKASMRRALFLVPLPTSKQALSKSALLVLMYLYGILLSVLPAAGPILKPLLKESLSTSFGPSQKVMGAQRVTSKNAVVATCMANELVKLAGRLGFRS